MQRAPRLAVVGAGDIGCGWATLALSAGWPVAIYDADSAVLQSATEQIAGRVQALVRLGRAEPELATNGLAGFKVGRSLLHAVTDADWIIEAAAEELHLKQRLLEQIEQVARLAAVLTSSSSGLRASDLCARLRRPERFLVTHPLNPVELVPVVEVIATPRTDAACTEDVRFWLRQLGRAPIVLAREVPGNAVGRIAAAVWRESIQLVLEGVLDVRDVDRLVSLGPALGWTAAGPHLTYHVGAGDQGVGVFLANLLQTFEEWWGSLATWTRLDADERARLIRAIERAYDGAPGRVRTLRNERDERLARIVEAVEGPKRVERGNEPKGADA